VLSLIVGFGLLAAPAAPTGGLPIPTRLAALGQGLYVLLDLEENTRITAHALAQIARRMGGG
jgi:hypothetical protein